MLTLQTLGGVALRANGGPLSGAATQQRRLALLAVLASAGDRGVSRDSLIALLWPDSPEGRARHALSQWLFLTRRELEVEDLVLGSTTLRLNRERIRADVTDFDDAVRTGDDGQVAALYPGPFLDGFLLSDAPEFERWVDGERDRRQREAALAIGRLARQAASRSAAEAVPWWRRLAALEPLSSQVALSGLQARAAAGDLVAAFAHGRRHEEILRRELDIAPSAEFAQALAAVRRQLREASSAAPAETGDPYLLHLRERLAEDYVVDRSVARSSTASQILVRRTSDDAPRLLRVFLPDLMARSDRVVFLAGVQRAQALRHAAIDEIERVDDWNGIVFTASSHVGGASLRDQLDQGGVLPPAEAIPLVRAIASALAHAHDHDVVHGDLTPRRVLLQHGDVRVSEFAILPSLVGALAGTPHDSMIGLGTPAYTSPELLAGDAPATTASDVYSLGCLCYQMLIGEPPHAAASARGIIINRLRSPRVTIATQRADMPASLASLIDAMLAPSAADRPAAGEVCASLAG